MTHPPLRFNPRAALLATAALFLFRTATVHAQDGQVDLKSLRTSLAQLKQQQQKASTQQRNSIYQDFRGASADNASALAFYEEAMQNTVFNGQNRQQTAFHDWKQSQADKFKDQDFLNALRLHLVYITITLERGNGVEVKQLLPELIDYTGQASQAGKGTMKDPFMKKPITDSIFVDWYQIGDWVSSAKDWDMKPGDVDGIYDKIILPELRTEKDPRLIAYWDNRIETEATDATDSKLTFEINKFNQVTRPSLLWSRAEDLIVIGQKNNAILAMYNLIKQNPQHPDASDWVTELEELLTPAAAPSAAPVAAASPTAAAAASPAADQTSNTPPASPPGPLMPPLPPGAVSLPVLPAASAAPAEAAAVSPAPAGTP